MKRRIYIIQTADSKNPGLWRDVESTMLWHKAMDIMHDLADAAMLGDSLRVVAHTLEEGSDQLGEMTVVGYWRRTSDTTDYKEEDYE